MPIYSYHCTKCDKEFELLIGMSEKAICPNCNSKKLERVYARVVKKKPAKGRGIANAAQPKRRAKAAPAPARKPKGRVTKRAAKR